MSAVSSSADFKRRSIVGVAQVMSGRLFQVALNFASIVVLARILSPADFGIIATVSAFIALLIVFRDAGLTMAAVRAAELTAQQSTNMFWMTLALSAMVALGVATTAPLISQLYHQPELTAVMQVLAFAGILEALGLQHGALLRRELRLGAYAMSGVVAETVAIAVAIAGALNGWAYWALVAKMLIGSAINSALLWMLCKWRPGRPRRNSGVMPLVRFGGQLTLAQWLWTVLRKVDDALISWAWGATAVGYYTRAYGLLLLPTQQLTTPLAMAAIPTLSRLQDDAPRFRRYYLRALEFVAFIGFPLVVLLFVVAEDFVSFVFGDKWLPSVPIFRALGPAALVEMMAPAASWIYTPLGRSDRELRMAAIYVPLYVVAVLCGLPWGAIGVACGISLVRVLAQPFNLAYCYRGSPVSLQQFFLAVGRPFLAAMVSGVVAWALHRTIAAALTIQLLRLVCTGTAMALLYLLAFGLLPGGRVSLAELFATARELILRRGVK
jgi:O-antigen/teichoic acid export membrane protein